MARDGSWTEWMSITTLESSDPPKKFQIFVGVFFAVLICFAGGVAVYSYRNFKCLRKGDDTVYLMSTLEREVDERIVEEPDFMEIDFSPKNHRD